MYKKKLLQIFIKERRGEEKEEETGSENGETEQNKVKRRKIYI